MLVNVKIAKLRRGRVRIDIGKFRHDPKWTQSYDSAAGARGTLRDMGVPKEALDFYFGQIFESLLPDQELTFPAMNIPEYELRIRGFKVCKAA